ncbi:arrestin homolog isoform X1 [Daktulosphaira vitifoliae]|uniref:arrestin homolog isoform X1 n=1 Tax=Daktulosphaira vitifoliae TaxID=58002 RepID=UPI0021AA61AE|nr:arrestin homolog isoform X1 [Daktulosphaira vitifoliae]XP_050528714.1 arrestin homolog isoform X1 [Daktulosphaira vitifoliae]
MPVNFTVFKKCSSDNKMMLYLCKRDIVDHISFIDPIDGIIVLDNSFLKQGKIFGQVVCSFRYGRKEDEVMGLNFQKDMYLASVQIYPSLDEYNSFKPSNIQVCLLSKLGSNAVPFRFKIPQNAPPSVILQDGSKDRTDACGVQYYVKIFAGLFETDHNRAKSSVAMRIRKIQYAPIMRPMSKHPCTIVRKDFMFSPGQLELEVALDKQVYTHGENIMVTLCIRNGSNKTVKKIKVIVQQMVDIMLFQNGQCRTTVAEAETQEGCPILPGSSIQKTLAMWPALDNVKGRYGVAIEDSIKDKEPSLASSVLVPNADISEVFGIIVSYLIKVKLYLGALGGDLTTELPFLLMNSQEEDVVNVK